MARFPLSAFFFQLQLMMLPDATDAYAAPAAPDTFFYKAEAQVVLISFIVASALYVYSTSHAARNVRGANHISQVTAKLFPDSRGYSKSEVSAIVKEFEQCGGDSKLCSKLKNMIANLSNSSIQTVAEIAMFVNEEQTAMGKKYKKKNKVKNQQNSTETGS